MDWRVGRAEGRWREGEVSQMREGWSRLSGGQGNGVVERQCGQEQPAV